MDEPPGPLVHLTAAVIVLQECMYHPFKPNSTLVTQGTIAKGIGLLKITTLLGLFASGLTAGFYSHCPINWNIEKQVPIDVFIVLARLICAMAWYLYGYMYGMTLERYSVSKETLASTMDIVWGSLIGIGVIPAAIALLLRYTSTMSKRHTANIDQENEEAASEHRRCLPIKSQPTGSCSTMNRADDMDHETSDQSDHGIGGLVLPLHVDAIPQAQLRNDLVPLKSSSSLGLDCLLSNSFGDSECRLMSSTSTTPSRLRRLRYHERQSREASLQKLCLIPHSQPSSSFRLENGPESLIEVQHTLFVSCIAHLCDWLRSNMIRSQVDFQSKPGDARSAVNYGTLRSLLNIQNMP